MTTTTTTKLAPAVASPRGAKTATSPSPRLTPLPDPPQCPDMATQYPNLTRAHIILEDWVQDWPNALVMGGGYLCYDAGDIRHALYPDCLVSLNLAVPPDEVIAANGYVISEVGKPPDFVLEVASRSTGRRDYTIKRDIYARYRVREYWRFDHTGGRYHDAALVGEELVDGVWRRIRVRRTRRGYRGYSRVLGLEVCWEDGILRFRNPATREYLPDLTEAKTQMAEAQAQMVEAQAQMVEAQAEAIAERVDRQVAETQRDAERTARLTAEVQIDRVRDERDAARQELADAQQERDALLAELRRLHDAGEGTGQGAGQ